MWATVSRCGWFPWTSRRALLTSSASLPPASQMAQPRPGLDAQPLLELLELPGRRLAPQHKRLVRQGDSRDVLRRRVLEVNTGRQIHARFSEQMLYKRGAINGFLSRQEIVLRPQRGLPQRDQRAEQFAHRILRGSPPIPNPRPGGSLPGLRSTPNPAPPASCRAPRCSISKYDFPALRAECVCDESANPTRSPNGARRPA